MLSSNFFASPRQTQRKKILFNITDVFIMPHASLVEAFGLLVQQAKNLNQHPTPPPHQSRPAPPPHQSRPAPPPQIFTQSLFSLCSVAVSHLTATSQNKPPEMARCTSFPKTSPMPTLSSYDIADIHSCIFQLAFYSQMGIPYNRPFPIFHTLDL